jgi:hypothetical protein
MVTRDMVIERLAHFNYVADESDYPHIDYEMEITHEYVTNYCNITEIPTKLDRRIVDKICANFLFYKKNSGTLKNFDYDVVIKEIKEGDTTIKYAVGQGEDTPENRFDSFVKQLERGFDKWITPHRRLRW